LQDLGIRFAINEQQIRFQVALSVVTPLTAERVVTMFFGRRFVFCQHRNYGRDKGLQFAEMLSSLFALEVFAEGVGSLNPPH
jgi:hypothetical protein